MYKENALPVSVDRWRITGRIETQSPLHIGDGNHVRISERSCDRQSLDGADPSYATVHIGHNGKPVIPASSLKGALRAWAEANRLDCGLIKEVFGDQDRGGAITFHDAPLDQPSSPADATARFWCNERATALSPRVVIDPVTRSAAERLLFYVEYVPEGATFNLAITGRNATPRQRSLVLYVLQNAFRLRDAPGDDTHPSRLGSQVANGWGKVSWSRTSLKTLNLRAWLDAPPKMWHKTLLTVDAATEANWLAGMDEFETKPQGRVVRLVLTLMFDGPMLVNDPTRCKKGDQNGQNAVGHAVIRRENGQVFLPSASVRGAFRAQARRIWQTLAWDTGQNATKAQNTSAPRKGSQTRLAALWRVFGATGWRAPVEFDDFELRRSEDEYRQEFVAVDRFTGGAAKKKLFNAHALWKPTFTGDVIIRADRWDEKEWDVRPWVWLLLAFTLRDWIEGDGFIGFGRSKGYGGFRAGCEVIGSGTEVQLLRRVLERESTALASPELAQWGQSLKEAINAKEAV
jgi:CRISPR/Cas system CSM-associated protein Csm3 (group 7 of RAMP superfamily)